MVAFTIHSLGSMMGPTSVTGWVRMSFLFVSVCMVHGVC